MTIRTNGYMVGPVNQEEIPTTGAAALRATWDGTTGPIRWLRDMNELSQAKTIRPWARTERFDAAGAADWMRQRGLADQFTFDRDYNVEELRILADRKQAELRRNDIIARAPGGFGAGAARLGTSLAASLVDPLNIASAFIPIVGEARYANMLRAAVGGAGRAGVRASRGVVEGLAGAAMLEPLNYAARSQEQADYRLSDAIGNVLFGSVFGAAVHVGGGAIVDTLAWRAGRDLYAPEVNATDAGVDIKVRPSAREQAAGPGAFGNAGQVKIGEAYQPVQWAVMDAADLAPSMAKADNQYRDRNRAASQAQVQQIAANLDFNLLADSPVMDFGAPTLAKDLAVIGGNGRLAAIQRAYEIGRGDLYREAVVDQARRFGVSPEQVKGMERPVLVRVLQGEVDVRKAAIASNEGGSMRMSALEQAKVDAERLGDLRAFELNEDGAVSVAKSQRAVRKWVEEQPATQRAALLSSDGQLSAEGMQRLRNAMLFRAYGDSPTLSRLIEAVDPGSRNVAAALLRVSTRVAEMRDAIAAGDRYNLDISGDLQAAVEKLAQIRATGQAVSEALAQGDMLADGLSPEARQILSFMGEHIRSSRAIADFLDRFMDGVDHAGNPRQAGLFGNGGPPERLALLQQAAANYVPSAAELVESAPAQVQAAAMRTAVVQAVQDQSINVEAVVGQDAAGMIEAAKLADLPDTKPLNDPQAAAVTDEQYLEVPTTEEAELAAAEQSVLDAEAELAETVADLQEAGILKSAADIPELEPLAPSVREEYLRIRQMAEGNKPGFDASVSSIAAYVGGDAVLPPLKSHKASVEKIVSELGGKATGIKDVLRATVMVDSIAQARDALAALRQTFEVVGPVRETLLAGKSTGADGYRDIKANVRIGEIVAEIQINTKAMIAAKDGLDFKGGPGHRLYEQIRAITRAAERENRELTPTEVSRVNALRAESKAVYDEAFAEASAAADPRAADAAAKSLAETLVPFRSTEAYGNRRGGEASKASANSRDSSTRTGTPSTSQKENLLPTADILAQLPEDLRQEALSAQSLTEDADRLAEIARRASACALRKPA